MEGFFHLFRYWITRKKIGERHKNPQSSSSNEEEEIYEITNILFWMKF